MITGSQIVDLTGLLAAEMAIFAVVKLPAFYHLALEEKGCVWLCRRVHRRRG